MQNMFFGHAQFCSHSIFGGTSVYDVKTMACEFEYRTTSTVLFCCGIIGT